MKSELRNWFGCRWLALWLVAIGCGAGPGSETPAANVNEGWAWQEQSPGVSYYCDRNPRMPLVVYVVRIDRTNPDLQLYTTLGGRDRIGMAVLSEQVTFIPSSAGTPVAAINGDYYYDRRPLIGDPRTLLIRRGGELISGPGEDRAFFYLDANNQPHLTNVMHAFRVTWPNGKKTRFGLNEAPWGGDVQASLLTAAAGPSTRMSGQEIVLVPKEPHSPLKIGDEFTATIKEIHPAGFSKLTRDSFVLSLPSNRANQAPPLDVGMEVKVSLATIPDLSGATLALGGGPTLVRAGKVRDISDFPGYRMRNPRSAFGWNDRYYFFVQADGRQPRHSMGMSLTELADYMVKLGCECGLNLDGGGSCTTWMNGKTMNRPSEGRERPSATGLVVVRRNPADN